MNGIHTPSGYNFYRVLDLLMYRLTEAFPYLVTRVGVLMGELFSRRLASYGVSLPMYRVMAALWHCDGQRLGDLSEMTSVETSTLSRLVGSMQRKGLVSRRRPDSNGRAVDISLTRSGRSVLDRLIPLAQWHEKIALHGLDPDQVAILKQHLTAVYRNLDILDREISVQPKETDKPARSRRVKT